MPPKTTLEKFEKKNQDLEKELSRKNEIEESLKSSEMYKALILDSMSEILAYYDLDLRIIWTNRASSEYVGIPAEELVGRHCYEVWHQRSIPCDDCPVIRARETAEQHEAQITDPGGRTWHVRSYPALDENNKLIGLVEFGQDISVRKKAETELLEKEAQLKILSSQTEQFSLAAASMISMKDEKEIFKEISRAIVEYSDYQRVLISLFKDTPPYRDIIGYGGINGETIDRLKDVELSSDWYDGVFKKGIKIGHSSYYVPHSLKHILKQEATVYGGGPVPGSGDKWHPEDNLFVRMVDERGGFIGVISVDNSKSGVRPSDETVRPLEIFSSLISQIIILKKEQEQRKRLEIQLTRTHQLESIGTLAGGIAHDFNNLMMGILGNVSLSLMDLDRNHPAFPRLKNIEEYVKNGVDLTKQLLGFARSGKYEVKPIDMNAVIRDQSKMFGRTKKEITIHEQYEGQLWTVEVDRGQMEQVTMNVFLNASQAMPGGGDLFITTRNVKLGPKDIESFEAVPGRYVKIMVMDTGVGMDEETRGRVFDPFFTTKEMGRGIGLGLASAYGIIKNHGGFIDVQSETGKGTTLNIYLPATGKDPVKETDSSLGVKQRSECILFVDDEKMIIDVGEQLLKRLGYRVLTATSGKEAVDIFREKKSEIDLVILDMIMPRMGGGETFDTLKRLDPYAKVLLSSGYSINGQATEIMNRGCDGFIQKPFDIKSLSGKLREILERTEG